MIKMIVTDLDGTLLESDHMTISERNIKALRKASEKGVKIVISSGRPFCLLKRVIKTLGCVDSIMVSNGAASTDIEGNILSSDMMDYSLWKEVYEVLNKDGIVTEVYNGGGSYINSDEIPRYENPLIGVGLVSELKATLTGVKSVTDTLKGKGAEKLHCIYVPEDKFKVYKEAFEAKGLVVTSSIPLNMEINKRGVNKGTGLIKLCRALSIDPSEVMAFGDEENDVEMLEAAGFSYAMGNACESVKKAAKYIAPTNDEDGVAVVVEKALGL